MPKHLWTQFCSTFRAVLFASLAGAISAGTNPAGAIDNTPDGRGSTATKHLQRFREDAEGGSALAQYLLGVMYQLGEAVPQDHTEAAKWLHRAADQGLAVAQFALGAMYENGQGVPEDVVRAHMWLNLSAAHAARIAGAQKLARDALEMRDALAQKMTAAQIEEAEKLAREWKSRPEKREPQFCLIVPPSATPPHALR
jgi:TPR repeat protein